MRYTHLFFLFLFFYVIVGGGDILCPWIIFILQLDWDRLIGTGCWVVKTWFTIGLRTDCYTATFLHPLNHALRYDTPMTTMHHIHEPLYTDIQEDTHTIYNNLHNINTPLQQLQWHLRLQVSFTYSFTRYISPLSCSSRFSWASTILFPFRVYFKVNSDGAEPFPIYN